MRIVPECRATRDYLYRLAVEIKVEDYLMDFVTRSFDVVDLNLRNSRVTQGI